MTNHLFLKRYVLALMAGLAFVATARTESRDEILERIEAKLASLSDLSADFVQRVTYAFSDRERRFEGKLYLKWPNKFRMEAGGQAVVSDGDTLWLYSAENQQVTLHHPANFPHHQLADYLELYSLDSLFAEGTKGYRLHLSPRREDDYLTSLQVLVDGESFLAWEVKYTDINGKVTDFAFSNILVNKGLSDSLFIFIAPLGVEVVDLR